MKISYTIQILNRPRNKWENWITQLTNYKISRKTLISNRNRYGPNEYRLIKISVLDI